MDLSALLGRSLTDHLALAERVIQRVLEQVASDETVDASDMTPAERVADALGNRLTRLILDESSSPDAERSRSARDLAAADHEELIERNIVLASALGACECWGERVECPICDGEGAPGWLPPDPELYAIYVEPVASAVARPAVAVTPPVRRPVTADNQHRIDSQNHIDHHHSDNHEQHPHSNNNNNNINHHIKHEENRHD